MLKISIAIVMASCLLGQTPAPKPAAKPAEPGARAAADKVILSVGDQKITVAEYEDFLKALPEQVQKAAHGAEKRKIAEQFVRLKVLAQEARRRKLDQSPRLQQQLAFQRDNLLAGALFESISSSLKIDDAAVSKYFEAHKSEYDHVKVHHIMVKMEGSKLPSQPGEKLLTEQQALAKAQELRKRLLAGEDFATLAKAESDDPTSRAKGGDLGDLKHGQVIPAFEEAAFSLPVGQLSEPVKTPLGYHIIRVDQHDQPSLETVRPELEQKMRPELARKAVEAMRQQATVTIDDSYFGPPQ